MKTIHQNKKTRIERDDKGRATVSVITKDGQSRVIAENITCLAVDQSPSRARANIAIKQEFQPSRLVELFQTFITIAGILLLIFTVGFVVGRMVMYIVALLWQNDICCQG